MSNEPSILLNPIALRSIALSDAGAVALVKSLLTLEGRALKSDDRSDVRLHDLGDGGAWVVKRYGVTGSKLWLYRLLRSSRGWREWRGALTLAQAGVRCAPPMALVLDGRGEAVVMPYVPGKNLARWLARHSDPDERRRVADRVGRQIGEMATIGIVNRDHKATNLIIDERCAAGLDAPVVIDPAGLRRRRSDRQVYGVLALLYRTAGRRVSVPTRAALRCLRATLRADPSLAASSRSRPATADLRLRDAANAVAHELL